MCVGGWSCLRCEAISPLPLPCLLRIRAVRNLLQDISLQGTGQSDETGPPKKNSSSSGNKLYTWEGSGRSQRLRGLRGWAPGARWLELRFPIPPGSWMCVTSESCVFSGRGLSTGWSLVQRSLAECMCVLLSVISCNTKPLHVQWVGRRDETKKQRESRAGLHAWSLLQRVRSVHWVFRCHFWCSYFEDTTCDYIALFSLRLFYSNNEFTNSVPNILLKTTMCCTKYMYEGNSISKLQIVIENNRMEIMTYKQHLFFNIISIQI